MLAHEPAADEDSSSLDVKGKGLEGPLMPLLSLLLLLPLLPLEEAGGVGGFWKAASPGRQRR